MQEEVSIGTQRWVEEYGGELYIVEETWVEDENRTHNTTAVYRANPVLVGIKGARLKRRN